MWFVIERIHWLIACLMLLGVLSGCEQATTKTEGSTPSPQPESRALSLIVHPYDNPSRLVERFTPLCEYLSAAIGQQVALEIARSYVDQIQRISNGQADLAYMGPTPFLRAQDHYLRNSALKLQPLAAEVRQGQASYRSVIVVRSNSPIKRLEGLVDRTLALGAPHSFSSHYVPRVMMGNAGLSFDRLRDYAFLGRHERVALAVLHGDFDAGGLNRSVAVEYQAREPGLKIIATSPPLPPHLILARPGLPKGLVQNLAQALIDGQPDDDNYSTAMQALGKSTYFTHPDMASFVRARRVISAVESQPAVLESW